MSTFEILALAQACCLAVVAVCGIVAVRSVNRVVAAIERFSPAPPPEPAKEAPKTEADLDPDSWKPVQLHPRRRRRRFAFPGR